MDLKEIAAVSGKSGLFKVLKPTRTGVILESIDAQKNKLIANSNTRVSILKEISMYTTGAESSKPLEEILMSIHRKYGTDVKVDPKADGAELATFMESVVPDYDKERVYQSDIKKLVTWYQILIQYCPELFVETPKTNDAAVTAAPLEDEAPAKEEEKKPKAKKAATKKTA